MNLWIYGIADEDTLAVVCEFGKQVLKLDQEFLNGLMFKNVHRVGSTKSTNSPIIVAFLMAKDRMKFLKSASTLYNYNKKHNISARFIQEHHLQHTNHDLDFCFAVIKQYALITII